MTSESDNSGETIWDMYEDEARLGEHPSVPPPEELKPFVLHKHLDDQLAAGLITESEYEVLKAEFYDNFAKLIENYPPEELLEHPMMKYLDWQLYSGGITQEEYDYQKAAYYTLPDKNPPATEVNIDK